MMTGWLSKDGLHIPKAAQTCYITASFYVRLVPDLRVDFKRNNEYFAVRNRPHPYEMSLHFDV